MGLLGADCTCCGLDPLFIFCSETKVGALGPGSGFAGAPRPAEKSSALFKKSSSGASGAGSSFFSSRNESDMVPSHGLPQDQQNLALGSRDAPQYIQFLPLDVIVPPPKIFVFVSVNSAHPHFLHTRSIIPSLFPHCAHTFMLTSFPADIC